MSKAKQSKRRPLPSCKAILLCEKIIVDQDSLRPSLINVFETVEIPGFPWQLDEFVVFVQLSDGIGAYQVLVEVQDLAEGDTVNRSELATIEFADRLQRLNLVVAVPSLH